VAPGERRQIRAHAIHLAQCLTRHAGLLQLVQRARGGARESRQVGHRREISEIAGIDGVDIMTSVSRTESAPLTTRTAVEVCCAAGSARSARACPMSIAPSIT